VDAAPQTWHYGLVARWWAEFNVDGPEIAYFERFVRAGQPALDAGCGTGRLLLPYLRAGLDVDACDVSADMVALCRERAEAEGLSPSLWVQPLHGLDLPRRYRTIVACGVFGLGSTREQDDEALRRLHDHLEPGGLLLLDNEPPYAQERQWRYWQLEELTRLPEERRPLGELRRASDGSELGLSVRYLALDPLEQRLTLEIHAEQWRDGKLEAHEDHPLTLTMYFAPELRLMLERAGFVVEAIHGDHAEEPATPESRFHVFLARRPA
jgi:SAM-dependent methyltransferase